MSEEEPEFEDFSATSEGIGMVGLFLVSALLGMLVAASTGILVGLIVFSLIGTIGRAIVARTVRRTPCLDLLNVPCPACASVQTERVRVLGTEQAENVCNACDHRWDRRRTLSADL